MKNFLMVSLLLAGCSAGPPAQVGGKYQGYFGIEASNNKVGLQGELKQTGDVILGTMHLTRQKAGQQLDLDCSADGKVKGNRVTLRVYATQDKSEINFDGEFTQVGEPRIYGNANLKGTDGAIPFVLKLLK